MMIRIPRNGYVRILIPTSNLVLSKVGVSYFGTTAGVASSLEDHRASNEGSEYGNVDWSNLGFSLRPTDYMYVLKSGGNDEESFMSKQGQLSPYGNIELSPAAAVLNYGQGLFEGMKAYRREDGGICLFRPQENAIRMQIGARRLCMPFPSVDQFVDAVKQTTLANRRWIPPPGKGSLYIRPLLMGSGPVLGLAPAPEYTFLIFASPVGNYFKTGTVPLNLYVEEEFHRATPGGAGGVKSITNYAPVTMAITRAKEKGFSDVLFLDPVNKRNIEEVSACNVFILKNNVISTPAATGTILEGVTRKTILDIARDLGYQVEERGVSIDELIDADEVFCTGTAVVVASVGSVTYCGTRTEYKLRIPSVSEKLRSRLTGIQLGTEEDKRGWVLKID